MREEKLNKFKTDIHHMMCYGRGLMPTDVYMVNDSFLLSHHGSRLLNY